MTNNITHCDPAEGFCAECRQAAANKAAEEGGLPMTVREAFEDRHEGYEFPSEALKSGALGEYMAGWRAADRASRQVANKAEVEQSSASAAIWDAITRLERTDSTQDERFAAADALRALATPPATTGASTARDQALEEATIAIEDFEEKKRFVSFDEIAKAIRALKGSIGASTALTDERAAFEWWALNESGKFAWLRFIDGCYTTTEAQLLWEGWKAAREVAAQAGQVAVAEGWKLVPVEPTDDMKDAPEVKVGGCYSCSPEQVGWHDCAEIYRLMVAAAPSPAKESK